jgi:hypothetical protein
VTVQLTIAQQSHGSLRIEVYSKSPGEAVYVDAVALR